MNTQDIPFVVLDQNTQPVAGAVVTATLDRTDYDTASETWVHIVQNTYRADEDGEVTLTLWPNARGNQSSLYRVTASLPNGTIIFDRNASFLDEADQDFYDQSWPVSSALVPTGGGMSDDALNQAKSYADYVSGQAQTNATQAAKNYTDFVVSGISGSITIAWGQVTGKPTIPTNNNQLTNGAGYTTQAAANSYVDGRFSTLAPVATTGAYASLTGAPTIPSKTSQLSNDAGFTTQTASQNYADSKVAALAQVARTGVYADLTGKPTIPTNTNQLTNGAGFATLTQAQNYTDGKIAALAAVASTGDYNSLINKPAGGVNADWNATAGAAQILNKPTLGTAASKNVDVANGVATLDGTGRLKSAQTPLNAIGKVLIAENEVQQLSFSATANPQDVCIRTDQNRQVYFRNTNTSSTMGDWELAGSEVGEAPTDGAQYVRQNGGWSEIAITEAQASITTDTQLTSEYAGAILFCASSDPILITAPARESVPDGWQVTIIQAGVGRVRIDGAGLAADGNNCLTKRGTGATLAALDAAITASVAEDFWLAGALTEHRESLLLESGSALSLENNQPLELEV